MTLPRLLGRIPSFGARPRLAHQKVAGPCHGAVGVVHGHYFVSSASQLAMFFPGPAPLVVPTRQPCHKPRDVLLAEAGATEFDPDLSQQFVVLEHESVYRDHHQDYWDLMSIVSPSRVSVLLRCQQRVSAPQ